MNFLTLVGRALRGEQLTPAERGVYRFLKTLLISALTAGLIAGVEYGNSLATGAPFRMGNLVNAVMMAIGISLLHGVQKWAVANGQIGALLSNIVQRFTPPPPDPTPPPPPTPPAPPKPTPALPKQPLLPMGATFTRSSPFSVADAQASPANTNPAAPIVPSLSLSLPLPLPTGVTSNATPAYLAPDEPMDAKATLPTLATVFKRAAVSAPLAPVAPGTVAPLADVSGAQGKNDVKTPDVDAPADATKPTDKAAS